MTIHQGDLVDRPEQHTLVSLRALRGQYEYPCSYLIVHVSSAIAAEHHGHIFRETFFDPGKRNGRKSDQSPDQ